MKRTYLPAMFLLVLGTALLASCSKNDAVIKDEEPAAQKVLKLQTMDDGCTKTETVRDINFSYSNPTCDGGEQGETITEDTQWDVSETCGNTTTYTHPTTHSTIFSKGCSTPPSSPLPYPFPTRVDGLYVSSSTLDFVEDNIEYYNNSFLTVNPSILQALRDVQNNSSITTEADNVNVDDRPGDPYVREQIYWAMFGVVLVQQIGLTDATTLATNMDIGGTFATFAVPGALAKKAAFTNYMSTDMPSGGLPELRAWLENRMQQGSF